VDGLSLFGFVAVSSMLVCYALEERHHLYVLGFGVCCLLSSLYGFLQGAWPFGLVEVVFAGVAFDRWRKRALKT
jgi:hypothetical protein